MWYCEQGWHFHPSKSPCIYREPYKIGGAGIATGYGLDVPGIESRWEGAQPAYYTIATASFPRAKRPGCAIDHPPPSSAEVKKTVEL
jgi:hypothetical protein